PGDAHLRVRAALEGRERFRDLEDRRRRALVLGPPRAETGEERFFARGERLAADPGHERAPERGGLLVVDRVVESTQGDEAEAPILAHRGGPSTSSTRLRAGPAGVTVTRVSKRSAIVGTCEIKPTCRPVACNASSALNTRSRLAGSSAPKPSSMK